MDEVEIAKNTLALAGDMKTLLCGPCIDAHPHTVGLGPRLEHSMRCSSSRRGSPRGKRNESDQSTTLTGTNAAMNHMHRRSRLDL